MLGPAAPADVVRSRMASAVAAPRIAGRPLSTSDIVLVPLEIMRVLPGLALARREGGLGASERLVAGRGEILVKGAAGVGTGSGGVVNLLEESLRGDSRPHAEPL